MCRHLCSALDATSNETVSENGAHSMTGVLRQERVTDTRPAQCWADPEPAG